MRLLASLIFKRACLEYNLAFGGPWCCGTGKNNWVHVNSKIRDMSRLFKGQRGGDGASIGKGRTFPRASVGICLGASSVLFSNKGKANLSFCVGCTRRSASSGPMIVTGKVSRGKGRFRRGVGVGSVSLEGTSCIRVDTLRTCCSISENGDLDSFPRRANRVKLGREYSLVSDFRGIVRSVGGLKGCSLRVFCVQGVGACLGLRERGGTWDYL